MGFSNSTLWANAQQADLILPVEMEGTSSTFLPPVFSVDISSFLSIK